MSNNIKMDLKETGMVNVHWIHLAQNRDEWQVPMSMVMNLMFQKLWEIS
jgi:hypothetical protein